MSKNIFTSKISEDEEDLNWQTVVVVKKYKDSFADRELRRLKRRAEEAKKIKAAKEEEAYRNSLLQEQNIQVEYDNHLDYGAYDICEECREENINCKCNDMSLELCIKCGHAYCDCIAEMYESMRSSGKKIPNSRDGNISLQYARNGSIILVGRNDSDDF